MKPARLIALLLLICPIACSYPIQLNYPATPHFYGRVVDRDTKKPIPGAMVFLKGDPSKWARTTAEGYFDMASVFKEFRQPIYGDLNLPTPSGTLLVEADGYKPLETGILQGETVSVLDIELERQ